MEGGVTSPPLSRPVLPLLFVEMLEKEAGVFDPLSASGGAALVLGPGLGPALVSPGIHLTANPDFGALRAFGEIEQVALVETAGIAPFARVGLVGAGQIDGVKTVIVPNGGRD